MYTDYLFINLLHNELTLLTFAILCEGTVIPIADTHDADGANYLDGEKSLRSKVAAVYRLVDLFNWTRGFNSLITVSTI